MERKELPLFNKEPIVIVDHERPDAPIMANVQNIKEHSQEGEEGERVFVQTLDGRSFDFSTLLRIGKGRFTSNDDRYRFYRALSLDPKDPQDKKVIINTMRVSSGLGLNGQDQIPQSQNGQSKLK